MNEERTLQEFVEDLVSEAHDLKYILAVARSTRWSGQLGEIEIIYKSVRKE